MIQIITGVAKGKRLKTLEGDATRPTSQRIKEAMFSSIQFDIEGRRVLDLFAGSGQLGLEALSRGASGVMFTDMSRDAENIVKENARALGFFDKCRYLVTDYRNYIRKAAGREKFDLVFIDPPYSMMCALDAALRLKDADMLNDGALLVLEMGEENTDLESADFADFELLKYTRYGKKTSLLVLLYHKHREGEYQ